LEDRLPQNAAIFAKGLRRFALWRCFSVTMLDLPSQVFMLGSVHEDHFHPIPRSRLHRRDCRARAMVQMA
jgi:hypothetical protein